MEHLFLKLPRGRVLLVNVVHSADGHGVGYGMMLIRMRRALLAAQAHGTNLFFVPSQASLNAAVLALRSPDVAIIDPDSWRGRALRAVWVIAAPWRAGAPWLWLRRSLAALVAAPTTRIVKRSTWLPRELRRKVLAQDGQSPFKTLSTRYAALMAERWQTLVRVPVLDAARALDAEGKEPPVVRLQLPPDLDGQAARAAAALGIPSDQPIVTVHVRESGYRATNQLRQRDWDEIRNARIETFFPAFAALVRSGYTVVRLGDPTMTPITQPGVVDLATHADRHPLVDIWCVQRSRFLVGCDSGPSWLAMLLNIPILTVNAVHFRDVERPQDRVICKLARDQQTGALLSVAQMLTREFLAKGFKSDRYACIDNTPADIEKAVMDMIEVVDGREQRSWDQKNFSHRLYEVHRAHLAGESALEGVAVAGRRLGTLSRRFARDHFERSENG